MKDGGTRQQFESGMMREGTDGRGMPSLISPYMIRRLSILMEKGANKYEARNWEKGCYYSRYVDSMYRHLLAFHEGDKSEDHLASLIFNAMALIHFEELGAEEFDDMPHYKDNKKNIERGTARSNEK